MDEVRTFLMLAARHLSQPFKSTLAVEAVGELHPYIKRSASTFTTFGHLAYGAVYLRDELPLETELFEEWIGDYAWGSCGPIRYSEVAHILIPRYFDQETFSISDSGIPGKKSENWNEWRHEQDIDGLSRLLLEASIGHKVTEWALEMKRF